MTGRSDLLVLFGSRAFVKGEGGSVIEDGRTRKLRRAREQALDAGPDGDAGGPGSLRPEIMTSWRRCRLVGADPSDQAVPYEAEFERPNRLLRAAGPVIDRLAEQMEGGPVSILLADAEAQIIDRRAGGREIMTALDKAFVSPGFRYAEEFTGTNGIGTALEAAKPFVVSGSEHFRESLQEFTCIGSPVTHPITGRVEGVLDVSCRVGDTNEIMKPLVLAAVREIEARMYADSSCREQMLLDRFMRANRRTASAVVSLNEDVVMANTAASALLDLSDQAMLWDWACRMLGTSDEYRGEVRLTGDVVALARASRVGDRGAAAGVLIEIKPPARGDGRATIARRVVGRRSTAAHPEEVPGTSVGAHRLREDIKAASCATRPVLLHGEPGVGKLHVARQIARRRARHEQVTILDAALAQNDQQAWMTRLTAVVAETGVVIIRHLDRLPQEICESVEAIVDSASPGQLLATTRVRDTAGAHARVLDHFPLAITVPPLRYRADDIVDLVPGLLGAHTSQRPVPRLLPGAARVLAALDWPGNLRELESVLVTALTRSMGLDIAKEHLPAGYRAPVARDQGAALQRAERDVVLEALVETKGNKLAAAERLGIARSTLYRKMRALGIDEKHLPTPPARS